MTTAFLAGYMSKAAAEAKPGFNQLVNAVAAAETGNLKNPYVRTGYSGGAGSSAWGPWQIGNMLTDYTPERNPGFVQGLNDLQRNHLYKLLNQRTAMLHFGRRPDKRGYHPKWDYSKPGNSVRGTGYAVQNEQDKVVHAELIRKIMRDQLQRRKINPEKASLSQVARTWQGKAMPESHRKGWNERAQNYLQNQTTNK